MGFNVAHHLRSRVLRRAASLATCAILVSMSVQMAPAVAAADKSAVGAAMPGPSATLLSKKAAPTEIVSKRTAYSDTYDNHDGSYTASVNTSPINYKAAGSTTYQPIDTAFADISGGNGRVRASHMANPVEVGAPDDASGFVSMDTGEGVIRLSLAPGVKPGQAGSRPSRKGSQANVPGVMPNIDLQTSVENTGIHTYFVLNSRPTSSSFSLTLDTAGLTPSIDSGGQIQFFDGKGAQVATMPAPYATDSTVNVNLGSGNTTWNSSYSLAKQGPKYLLTVSVDPTWLDKATYPVYVDPSVMGSSQVWNNSVSDLYTGTTFSNMQETTIPPYYHEFFEGYEGKQQWGAYLRFDLAAAGIPAAYVTSASATLFPYWQWVSSGAITYVSLVTAGWDPNKLTWDNAPFHSNPYSPGTISSFLSDTGSAVNIGLPLSTVQGWATGSIPNDGVYLYGPKGNENEWKRFVSSSDTTGAAQPVLNVTYTIPSATTASVGWTSGRTLNWNYNPNGGPGEAAFRVQVATDSAFTNLITDTPVLAGPVTSYSIPTGTTLTDGATYYWHVTVSDGFTGSAWSSAASFRWDVSAPTWNGFTGKSATGSKNDISGPSSGTSFDFTWNGVTDTESGFSDGTSPGRSGLNYQLQFTDVASPDTCGTTWNAPVAKTLLAAATDFPAPIPTAGCYRLAVAPIDYLGNGGIDNYQYSGAILFDPAAPSAPTVTATAGNGFSQAQAQGSTTIVYRPDIAVSIPLTASNTDSLTDHPSGVASSTFSAPAGTSAAAWASTKDGPEQTTLTWTAQAAGTQPAATTLSVTSTSGAGLVSEPTTVILTPDVTPQIGPAVGPATGSIRYQQSSDATLAWTVTDSGGAGLPSGATATVNRYSTPANKSQPGSCDNLPTAKQDESSSPAIDAYDNATVTDSDLASGNCYYWTISVTDNLGLVGSYQSGWLMVDTSVPVVPSVTAVGTGASAPYVYQSAPDGVVYVNPQGPGSLTLTAAGSSAGTYSGIGSASFSSWAAGHETGWTRTDNGPVNVDPTSGTASIDIGWVAPPNGPVDTSLDVNTNTNAGVPSAAVPISIRPDAAAPVGDWKSPVPDSLTAGSATSYSLSWVENQVSGPGIAARSLQREKVAIGAGGGCPNTILPAWDAPGAKDGSPTNDTSGVTVSGLQNGYCYRWALTLTDRLGLAQTFASGSILVDTSPPDAYLSIDSPKTGQPVAGSVGVIGSVTDGDLSSWELDYGSGVTPSGWTKIAGSTAQVNGSSLGTWLTGGLPAGVYTLRLSATDWLGRPATLTSIVYVDNADRGSEPYYSAVPFSLGGGWNLGVNVATGEATLGRTLFDIPGIGPDQTLSLAYNSADTRANDPLKSPFGTGWSSNLTQYLDLSAASKAAGGFVVWHRADGAEVPFGLVNGVWIAMSGHYETLAASGSGYTITYTDQSRLTFDSAGRLVAITNRYNGAYRKSLTIAWGSGTAVATDAVGRATTITFAGSTISRVVDSAGRTWSFGYAGANLASIVDAAGNKTDLPTYAAGACPTASFSGACMVVRRGLTSLDPSGSASTSTTAWTIGYDASGRVNRVADPGQASAGIGATFNYVGAYATGMTAETTPGDPTTGSPALTTTYYLDANGRGWVDSLDHSWTQGSVPVIQTTKFGYDAQGNVKSIVSPIDATHTSTKSWTYNDSGTVATETDPLTASSTFATTYTYDTNNNLQTVTVAGTSTTPNLQIKTAYFYDSAGHVGCKVQNLTIDINTPGLTCDAVNGPKKIPSATADSNLVTIYAYDTNDDLVSQTDPTGVVTKYGYDAFGDRTSVVANYVASSRRPGPLDEATVDSTNVTTTYTYDQTTTAGKAGLATAEIDPITNRIIPATSATTSFTYDALGHVLTKVIPGDSWAPSSETVSTYDEFGNETLSATCTPSAKTSAACISAAMNKTTTTRDPMGRAVSVTSFAAADTGSVSKPASTTTAKVSYDGAGNAWQSVSAAGVTSTSSFDGLGRVVHEASAGTWASHAYDGLGDEITTTTPASNTTTTVTTRVFNPNGTVHTQTTTAAGTITYLYDAIGRQIGAIDAAGLTVSSTNYDALGHATSAMTTNTVTPLTGGAATTVKTIVDTTYDPDGRVTSVTLPYVSGATKTTNTMTYDPLGRVAQTTVNYISGSSDPAANLVTKNYYDAAGHLIASLDPKHIATRWVYALGGQLAMTISNCTDRGGSDGTTPPVDPATCAGTGTSDGSTNLRTQSSTVSGSGEIVTTQTSGTAPATVTTTTTYDGKGRVLKTVVDPASGGLKLETDYAYDSAGRLFAQASPTPDGSGKAVKIIVFYPATGQVQKTIDNCTDTSADATWFACTGSAAEDGTHNLTTTYSYDTAGHVSSQSSPSHAVTSYTYDGAGRVTTTTTNNAITAYYYDAAGRKIAVATPNELLSSDGKTKSYTVTRFAYDAAGNMVGQLVNCTDSGTTAPVGDAAIASCSGKSGSTWNSSTNVLTTYKYDAQGHVISMTGPSPVDNGASTARVTTDYAFDADGRTCRVIENATSAVDPTTLTCTSSVTSTTTTDVSTTYTYDKAGHLASSTQGADPTSDPRSKYPTATTSYLYDGVGHLISQTDATNSRTTTWTYDVLGRKATETDSDTPGGATVAWLYDAAGRMCRRVAAATRGHLPDVSGLTAPCTAKINAAAIDTRYAYDSAGNATSATDAKTGQVVSATYDAVHRPTAVTNTGGAIGTSDPGTTYAYSSLTTVGRTDPSGTYGFTLDAYGRETAMSSPIGSAGSDSYSWTYGPSGALISQSEPLGALGTTDLTITNAYDAIGRLAAKTTATLTGTVAGPTIDAQSYTYNAAGAELSGADTLTGNPMGANGTSTYGYDALGRLTSAAVPTQPSQAYTWNATADRSSVQSGTSQPVTTYYNVASQPFSDSNGGQYRSDNEGRLTAQPGQRLQWDNLGRLTEVDGPGSSVTTYAYDPLDRLVAVVNGGVTTKYLYVGLTTAMAKTIISTGSTTSTTTHYTDAAGTELAQVTGTSGPVYLGRNGHGDVTSTVNAAGSVVSAAQYDPFGKLTSSYGTPPANRWQGSLFEPNSGLYYVIARWYSPTLGRFLSVDPLVGSTARPQSLDRYAYVAGNPLGGVDPRGTCTWDTISMSCKDSSGVDQSSFQSNLAAATTVPFNKCLATNFHADGCTSTSTAWVETVSSTVCTQTNNYASSCTVYHSASRDLIDATDQIVAAVKIEEERVASEEKRYEAREAFYPKPPLPLPVVTPTRTPCSWWPQDGDSCESQIAGGLGNLAGDAADPIVSHIWPATGGAAVNWAAGVMESKLFPSLGQTSGLCFGGAYAVAASIGFSFCIVHDGEGYWAGLINKNVGDSPAIDASWTGSYFESTANSYLDLVGPSTDYMVSGGEVVSGGVDLDIGTGRDKNPVYSLTGSAGGGFTLGIPVTVSRMYTRSVCEDLKSFSKTWDCMMATNLNI